MRKHKVFPILILWLFIALLWWLYRYFFRFSECTDELIFKPLIFLVPVFWFVKFQEKKRWESLGITKKAFKKSILIGTAFGLIFSLEGILTSWFKNKEIIFNPEELSGGGILKMGFISLMTGFSEEVLNRGFLLNRFWTLWENELLANLLSSVLFLLFHLPMAILVLDYAGKNLLGYGFLIFVLGIADGFVFGRTRNVLGSTISHALWNWSVVLLR